MIYTHAGPEIGVASTKTFTATLTACYLLALALGPRARLPDRGATAGSGSRSCWRSRGLMEQALAARRGRPPRWRRRLAGYQNFLYLGRGVHYPIALEGALKLKEISYIHAEGYAAGEMKHGPIALIDERMPVVALAPRDASYDRMVGNMEEVRARGGRVIAVCHRGRHRDRPAAPTTCSRCRRRRISWRRW